MAKQPPAGFQRSLQQGGIFSMLLDYGEEAFLVMAVLGRARFET